MEAPLVHAGTDSVCGSQYLPQIRITWGDLKILISKPCLRPITPGSLKVAVRIQSFQSRSGISVGVYFGNNWLEPLQPSWALEVSVPPKPGRRVEWGVSRARGHPQAPLELLRPLSHPLSSLLIAMVSAGQRSQSTHPLLWPNPPPWPTS